MSYDDLSPQEILIDLLNDEYSLAGIKAPEDAPLWTEDQIQRYFDSGGKVRPSLAAAAAAREAENEAHSREEQEAVANEVARGTPFGVLGIPRNATHEQVKKAYRQLGRKWHPDKNRGNEEEAALHFRRVAEAYEVLGDPQARTAYEHSGIGWAHESAMQFQRADAMYRDMMRSHGEFIADGDWWARFDARLDGRKDF